MKKKYLYIIGIAVMAAWVAFRIFVIASESARVVTNPMRQNAQFGAPVETIAAEKKTDALRIPLQIKSNRANVSCGRVGKFKVGQKVGAGRIASVSDRINLDTGMCQVATVGAADGPGFAMATHTGYFIPVYAVRDGRVMLDIDGIATPREVKVLADDSDHAVVTGLTDDEVVILSPVEEGTKVR